jgi:hypothetical protein
VAAAAAAGGGVPAVRLIELEHVQLTIYKWKTAVAGSSSYAYMAHYSRVRATVGMVGNMQTNADNRIST